MDQNTLDRMRQPHPQQKAIDARSVQLLRQSQTVARRDFAAGVSADTSGGVGPASRLVGPAAKPNLR